MHIEPRKQPTCVVRCDGQAPAPAVRNCKAHRCGGDLQIRGLRAAHMTLHEYVTDPDTHNRWRRHPQHRHCVRQPA